MERKRGETRVLGQKNRKQAFDKGIERGEGGRYRAEGASFRIFRGLQGPKWCAGRQTELRGRAQGARTGVAAPPPARLLASRSSDWRGVVTKAAEKAFEGRDGLGSAPGSAF